MTNTLAPTHSPSGSSTRASEGRAPDACNPVASFDHPQYKLDANGSIRSRETNEPITESQISADVENLLKAVVKYVHQVMQHKYCLVEAPVPLPLDLDAHHQDRRHCPIFASSNYLDATKLLVLVSSGKGLVPGIWSRSLVLRPEAGIRSGSMLNYIEKAQARGYSIMVLNPNTNSILDEHNNKCLIPGSSTPEQHVEYVWDRYISGLTKCKKLVFVGYGYGGVLVKHLIRERTQEFIERNGLIAFIESSHRVEQNDPPRVKDILQHQALYWESSNDLKHTKLQGDAPHRTGCICLSAGPKPSRRNASSNAAYTVAAVRDIAFEFFENENTAAHFVTKLTNSQSRVVQPNAKAPSATPTKPASMKNEKFCELCTFHFTLFDRRHHCRMCYRAVCNSCSPDRLFLPGAGTAQRVCVECATNGAQTTGRRKGSHGDRVHKGQSSPVDDENKDNSISVNDFHLLKVIGKGAFGKVMLVECKDEKHCGAKENRIYAMKVLKKAAVFAKNQVEHTKSERRILRDINHPFVVRLRFAFQTPDKLYLVMDYYPGGSLFYHLRKSKRFNEKRAQFYAAQLVVAMNHLHQMNIAYRDLKLENILMDSQGYIALTDFGLSKEDVQLPDGAKTFCGTAEYIAPELLRGLPYGKAVDWWGFGTLLYEMLVGQTPFYDRNRKYMFHNILHRDLKFPSYFSPDLRALITGLLHRDPAKRLGSGPGGGQEIMDHPYFAQIDWDKLLDRTLPAPFTPAVSNNTDTSNVANVFTREIPQDSPVTHKLGPTQQAQAHFEDFTYVASYLKDDFELSS